MTKTETSHLVADVFNTDFNHNLNYSTLGREILNTAEQHAEKRDFGLTQIRKSNQSWVLSRLTIEMNRMPHVFETYSIDTWIENIYRMFTNRNFCIKVSNSTDDSDPEVVGYARSVWALIDNDSRQPLDLTSLYGETFEKWLYPENPCPIDGHSRIRPLSSYSSEVKYAIRYNDIDCNGHVNSVKYLEHICNLFNLEFYKKHRLKRIELAYVAESYFGDTLHFFMTEIEPLRYQIEIAKSSTADETPTTVVRSFVTFA